MPKFNETFCSQCGGSFGPGDAGFSHCDQHLEVQDRDSPTVKRVMAQFESALARRRAYGPQRSH